MTPEEIRELRRLLQLTQVDLALAVDVAPLTVKRWEAGTSAPYRRTKDKLLRLARKAGLELGP